MGGDTHTCDVSKRSLLALLLLLSSSSLNNATATAAVFVVVMAAVLAVDTAEDQPSLPAVSVSPHPTVSSERDDVATGEI